MTTILGSIRRGLGGVARFSGRDSRFQFWPYAMLVTGMAMLVMGIGMGVTLAGVLRRLKKFAAEHPDEVTVVSGVGSYSIQIHGDVPGLEADFAPLFAIYQVSAAVAVLFLAAAVTRRLHDSGRRGWWGMAPLPFLFTGLALFPRVFADVGESGSDSLFLMLFFNNVLYVALLVLLIVLLAKRGDVGANRFGPPSAGAQILKARRETLQGE